MVKRPNDGRVDDGGAQLRTALRDLRIALALGTRRVASMAGLKDSDLDVLDVLSRGGPQSPSVLARRLSMQPATMTGVLRRLEDAGWVIRRHHEHDRRSVEIESVGFDRLDELYRGASLRLDALHSTFSATDVATIVNYLSQASSAITDATRALDDSVAPRTESKAQQT